MKDLYKLKSPYKKKLVISVIFLIAISCLIVWLYVNIIYIEEQKIKTAIEAEAIRVETALLNRISDTSSIAESMELQIIKNYKNKNYINQILQKFRTAPELNDIFSWTIFSWSDDKYNLIVDAKYGIMKEPIDLSSRDYMSLTKATPGKFYLGVPVIGSTSNEWMIPGGVGLTDKNGNYIGTISIGFEIESLMRSLNNSIKENYIKFQLVKESGLSITEMRYAISDLQNRSNAIDSIKKEIKLSEIHNSLISVNLVKNRHAYLIKKLDQLPYFLVFNCDDDFLKNELWGVLTSRLVEIIVILALSVILWIFVYKREKKQQEKIIILKEAAEKANAAKSEFLSKSSHDLKNYILGIFGLSRLILDGGRSKISESEDVQIVEAISDQSKELLHFVEDLLDTNQVESGDFCLGKIEKCDIKHLLQRMVLLNRSFAIEHDVSLKIIIENNLPKLSCDVRRMKQIMANLISNAIKYSKAETAVQITAKYLKKENQIYIEIADHGVGMTKEEIKMLLLGRGKGIDKSNISKKVESYGIGMTIVLGLVELHNGKIDIDSRKGVGTRVKLYFNVGLQEIERKDSLAKLANKISDNITQQGKSILLVEDNPVNIKITSKILQNEGYKVQYVENGREALEMLDEEDFDLILIDGEMPIMDGYKAAKEIRKGSVFKKFKYYKTIPIIALTSSSDAKTIKKSTDSGINHHIEKSTSKAKMLKIIKECLV